MSAHLTHKQRHVVELIVSGWTYREIGEVLGVTPQMVRKHVAAIVLLLPPTEASTHVAWSHRRRIRDAATQLLDA